MIPLNLEQYLRQRRWFETGFSICLGLLISTVNATTIMLDASRQGSAMDPWYPWLMEWSSTLVVLLLVIPTVVLCQAIPFDLRRIRTLLLVHLVGFLAFAVAHVSILALVRPMVFELFESPIEWTPQVWYLGLLYESRKDFLVYLFLVSLIYTYEYVLNRMQGEANFLTRPAPGNPNEIENQFLVKMLDSEYLVNVNQILWIQSAKNYVLLHCDEQGRTRAYPMRSTMQGILKRLDPEQFCRTHRTSIINRHFALRLETFGSDHKVVLKNGEEVPVSKSYFPDVQRFVPD